MKVRIIKATPYRWYDDQIGMIVNVVDMGETYFGFSTGSTTHYIHKSDCEILPEENHPEPFDLERALKGEKVITRDNKEVTEIHHFKTNKSEFCVVAIIEGAQFEYLINGSYESAHESKMDLFMAPRESEYVTIWVNVYYSQGAKMAHLGNFFDSKEEAQKCIVDHIGIKLIDTLPITFKRPK